MDPSFSSGKGKSCLDVVHPPCLGFCSVGVVLAASDWPNSDPSQWTSNDVYRILNNSPWSRPSKIKVSDQGLSGFGDQPPQGGNSTSGTWGNGGQMPTGMGGVGRRGMGGGGHGGAGRGSGGSRPSNTPKTQPAEVTLQWPERPSGSIGCRKKERLR